MRVSDKKFKLSFIVISLIVLLATILISLKLGSVNITFKELISGLFSGQSDGNIGMESDFDGKFTFRTGMYFCHKQ